MHDLSTPADTGDPPSRFLRTSELPSVTGLSVSFFEKARFFGRDGPPFFRPQGGRAVRYERDAVEAWLRARTVGGAS